MLSLLSKRPKIIVLITFGLVVCFFQNVNSTELSAIPLDPFGFAGETSQLCCMGPSGETMQPEDTVWFLSDKRSSAISEPYLETHEDGFKTCVNVTLEVEMNRRWFQCLYTPKNIAGTVLMTVDHYPDSDENFLCYSMKNDFIECVWEPQSFIYPGRVTVKVFYQGNGSKKMDNKECQKLGDPGKCSNLTYHHVYQSYRIALNKTYNLTTLSQSRFVSSQSDWKEFSMESFAKLEPLEVKVDWVNSTCISLEKTFFFSRTVEIAFNYSSHWRPRLVKHVNVIKEPPDILSFFPAKDLVTLCSLTPNTKYSIYVIIRPQKSLLWSEPFRLNVTTLEDVPARPPVVVPGSFHTLEGKNVTILYWQGLSSEDWHCSTTSRFFQFFRHDSSTGAWDQLLSLPGNSTQVEVHVDRQQKTVIRLYSLNGNMHSPSKGSSGYSMDYSLFEIPALEEWLIPPSNVTVLVGKSSKEVTVTWDSQYNGQAAVFWCNRGQGSTCHNSQIEWKVLHDLQPPDKVAKFRIPTLNPALDYMFGVSETRRMPRWERDVNASTGIMWTECTERNDGGETIHRSMCDRGTNSVMTVSSSDDKIGMIFGSVIGSIVFAAIVISIVCYYVKRYRRLTMALKQDQESGELVKTSDSSFKDNKDKNALSDKPDLGSARDNKAYEDADETIPPYHRAVAGSSIPLTVINETQGSSLLGDEDDSGTSGHSINKGDEDEDEMEHCRNRSELSQTGANSNGEGDESEDKEVDHCKVQNVDSEEDVDHYRDQNDDDEEDVDHYRDQNDDDEEDVDHYRDQNDDDEEDVDHYRDQNDDDEEDVDHYRDQSDDDEEDVDHYRDQNDDDEEDVDHYRDQNDDDDEDVDHYRDQNDNDDEEVDHYRDQNDDDEEDVDH